MPLPTSLSATELAALNTVLQSRAPASAMRYHYRVGGIDLTDDIIEAQWGRTGAELPGIEFSGRFKANVPDSIKREHMVVDLTVDTVAGALEFRRFTGKVRTFKNRRGRCEITAATGGYWLDRVRFDEDGVTYADIAPSEIIWDAVTRAASAGVYDFLYADIERVDGPKVRRDEFLQISKIDKLSRPIGAAVEDALLFFRDSPYNSPLCHRDRGPAEATSILHSYTVGRQIDPQDFEPESTSDDYYDVVIYRVDSVTGDIIYLTDPILIPGSAAPEGVGYEVPVSDESATGADDAYVLGQSIASRLIHGEATDSFTMKFPHPLMVDGDFVSIVEPFHEGGRTGTRQWIAEVDIGVEHHDKTQDLQLTMIRQSEDEDVPPAVAALSPPRRRGRDN